MIIKVAIADVGNISPFRVLFCTTIIAIQWTRNTVLHHGFGARKENNNNNKKIVIAYELILLSIRAGV